MKWETVKATLKSLQTMKIISINGTLCTIDGNRFVSLIDAFYQLKEKEERKQFIKKLSEGDYNALTELGYEYYESSSEKLCDLKGSVDLCKRNSESYIQNGSAISEKGAGAPKSDSGYIQNGSAISEMGTPAPISEHHIRNGSTKNSQSYPKRERPLQNRIAYISEIGALIVKTWEKDEFIKEFEDKMSNIFNKEEFDLIAKYFFEDKNEAGEELLLAEGLSFFGEMVLLFWSGGISEIGAGYIRNRSTEINIININKKINQENVLFEKNQNISTGGSLPAHPENNFNETASSSQEKEEEWKVDFDFAREVYSGREDKQSSLPDTLSYEEMKKKSRLPYFPVEEIENIIADPSTCLDRSDKIFINKFWEIAQEVLGYVETCDEEGNMTVVENLPIEGYCVEKNDLWRNIFTPALNETGDIITKGKMNIRGVDYPVTATEINPDDVDWIIDFKLTIKDGKRVYTISKKGFKNIYADPVPVTPRKGTREGREEDKAYMKEIILLGDDDDRYEELTPIELIIYNFLCEYFDINDDGSIESPKQNFLNRVSLGRFYLSVAEKGLTEKDFLSVLFNNVPDRQTGCLILKPRMFSSDKIKEWNAINGFRDAIAFENEQPITPMGED
jgi:hypothetical protein